MEFVIAVEGIGRSFELLEAPAVVETFTQLGVKAWTQNPASWVGQPGNRPLTDLRIQGIVGTRERFFLEFDGEESAITQVETELNNYGFTLIHYDTVENMETWRNDPSRKDTWNPSVEEE